MLTRRHLLSLLALAAAPGAIAAGAGGGPDDEAGRAVQPASVTGGGFHPDRIRDLAVALSASSFGADWKALAADLAGVPVAADDGLTGSAGFQIKPMPAGEAWDGLTDVFVVDPPGAGRTPAVSAVQPMGGFEILASGPEKNASGFEFRGATVFRIRGAVEAYGAAARGLAIRTADPGGEEIPVFRAIWIERRTGDAGPVVLHALLDSPSTTGSVRLSLRPGRRVVVDVELALMPRQDLESLGLAPLSATYLFSPGDGRRFDDWRPAVHDASGLSMLNGRGERLWRPLSNPADLQISAFADASPRAFGLVQRPRGFADYLDPDAAFERRPSLVVEPVGDWGAGWVTLVEIPSGSETNDNVVVFWRPAAPLAAGGPHRFTYRISATDDLPGPAPTAVIEAVRSGQADGQGSRTFVIDYRLREPALARQAKADVWASAGTVADRRVRVLEDGRVRLQFTATRQSPAGLVELRADLFFDDAPPGETWLYRWA